MRRSGTCKTCGATIRPSAADMSVAAASRKHYWKHHREVMLGAKSRADSEWDADKRAGRRAVKPAASAAARASAGARASALRRKRKAS